jgi:putative peptide zinc metalloprotease protein
LGNPHRLLKFIQPSTAWIFGKRSCLAWSAAAGLTVLLLLSRWSQLAAKWPSWHQLTTPQAWLGLGMAFVLTRTVHELGHALVCVRMGAKCHDTGLMFMMGIACPYVDVTDSWRLTNPWSRAAVASAGVYAEAVLATLAAWIWLTTHEGPLHAFAWQIMLVCTVSTLLFNANPLMRYDGYFVLSDLLKIPNLRERADRALARWLDRCLRDSSTRSFNFEPGMIAYGVLAACYRWSMLVAVLLAILMTARQCNVSVLGFGLAAWLSAASLVKPAARLVRWTRSSGPTGQLPLWRLGLVWAGLFLLLSWALLAPIPQRLAAQGRLLPWEYRPIYARTDGILRSNSISQDPQTLATWQVHRREPLQTWLALESKKLELNSQKQLALRQRFADDRASEQLLEWDRAIEAVDMQMEHRLRELADLSIPMPLANQFIPAPWGSLSDARRSSPKFDPSTIPNDHWALPTALGRHVPRGTLLGWQRSSPQWQVTARFSASQLPYVATGAQVRVQLEQDPWNVWQGQVTRIAEEPECAADGDLPRLPMGSLLTDQETSPLVEGENSYLVTIQIPDLERGLAGGRANLVIHSKGRSLAGLATDWLARNFRIR